MPRVPEESQQVAPVPLPAARLTAIPSPDVYGAGVGDVVRRAATEIYHKATLEADQTAFLDADTKLAHAQTSIQLQVLDMKGKDAAGAPEAAQTAWDKAIGDIQPSLQTPRVQRAFARASAARFRELDQATQVHVNQETTKYADQTTESSIKAQTDAASLNAMFPDSVDAAKQRQEAVLEEWRVRKGLPADSVIFQEKQAAVLSNTNREVVVALLNAGNDLSASAYYKANSTDFTAPDRDHVTKALEEGSTRGEALRQTNMIMGANPTDMKAALAEVDKITEPKVALLTRELVHKRFAEQDVIKKREVDQIYLDASNAIDQNTGVAPRLLVPPDKWAMLSLSEHNALEARSTLGGDRPNDNQRQLKYMALSPDVKASMSRSTFEADYWQHFDNATRHWAMGEYEKYHDAAYAEGKKEPQTTHTETFDQMFRNEMIVSGLFPADKSPTQLNKDDSQRYVRIMKEAQTAVERWELAHKRKATTTEMMEEITKVKDRAIKEVFVPGAGWFGGAKRKVAADLTEDEKGRAIVPVDKIPNDPDPNKSELTKLRQYILSKNRLVTPSKLERAYAQVLLGNHAAFDAIVAE